MTDAAVDDDDDFDDDDDDSLSSDMSGSATACFLYLHVWKLGTNLIERGINQLSSAILEKKKRRRDQVTPFSMNFTGYCKIPLPVQDHDSCLPPF